MLVATVHVEVLHALSLVRLDMQLVARHVVLASLTSESCATEQFLRTLFPGGPDLSDAAADSAAAQVRSDVPELVFEGVLDKLRFPEA